MNYPIFLPLAETVSGIFPLSRSMRRAWASSVARRVRRALAGSFDRLTRRAVAASVARRLLRAAALAAFVACPLTLPAALAADWTYDPATPITPSTSYQDIVQFGSGNSLTIGVGGNQTVVFGETSAFRIYEGASGVGEINRSTITTVTLSGDGTIVFGGEGIDDSWSVGTGQSFTTTAATKFSLGGFGASGGGVGGEGTFSVTGGTVSFGNYATFGGDGNYGNSVNAGSGGAGALNIDGGTTTFENRATIGGYGGHNGTYDGGNGGQGTVTISGGTTKFKGTANIGGKGGHGNPATGAGGSGGAGSLTLTSGDGSATFSGITTFGGSGGNGSGAGGNGGDGGAGSLTLTGGDGSATFSGITTFGGSGGIGYSGGSAGNGTLTISGGTAQFQNTVTLGGSGGNGQLGGSGGAGSLTLTSGDGSAIFSGITTFGGSGGNGSSVGSDGGDGTLTISGGTARFQNTVTLGGTGGSGSVLNGTGGNGKVTLTGGKIVLDKDVAMLLRGADATGFSLTGGTFQAATGVTVQATNMTLANTATLAFDMAGAVKQGVGETTNLTLSANAITGSIGSGAIGIVTSTPLTNGTYTLVSALNGTFADTGTVTYSGTGSSANDRRFGLLALSTAASQKLQLTVTAVPSLTLTWTNADSVPANQGVWSNFVDATSPHNWTDVPGGTAAVTQFKNDDTVVFDSTYATPSPRAITVASGGVSMNGMTVTGAGDWTFTGGAIGGAGGLTMDGGGVVTLANANTYTGGTIINGGTLSVSSNANLGATTGGVTIGDATLRVTNSFTSGRAVTLNHATGSTIDVVGADKTLTLTGATFADTGKILNKTGGGTLALDALAQSGSAINIASGTVKTKLETFGRALAGAGTLAVDRPDPENLFAFGPATGVGFNGIVDMLSGKISLDDGDNYTVLQNAALKLSAGGSAQVTQDRSIKSLIMNGGTLKFAVDSITPQGALTVTDTLDVSGSGTVMMDLDKQINTGIGMSQSLYDYATAASSAQQKLVGATNVIGSGTQLAWKNYAGEALNTPQTRALYDMTNTIEIGRATFDYHGTVKTDGLYMGYGLTQLQAFGGNQVILDSSGASSSPTINAKLTGAGGFTFSGSKNVSVGNAANDYTGATAIDNLTLSMLTNNALGQTSALDLTGTARLDMKGKSQAVGGLSGEAGTAIVTGNLTVNGGGSFAGAFNGGGSVTKASSGTLTLSGDSAAFAGTFKQIGDPTGSVHLTSSAKLGGTYTQDAASTLTSDHAATLDNATFAGTVSLAGASVNTLYVKTATFNNTTVSLGNLGPNFITATGNIGFTGMNWIAFDATAVGPGDYTLIGSGATMSGGVTNTSVIAGLGSDQRGGQFLDNNNLKYRIIQGNTSLTWVGTSASSNWNTTAANTNWTDGTIQTHFINGDNVNFTNAATGKSVTVASGGVNVARMNVEGSYTFSGGKITGYYLGKADAGTLTFENAATFDSIDLRNSTFDMTGTVTVSGLAVLTDETLKIDSATSDKIVAGEMSMGGKTVVDLNTITNGLNYIFLTGSSRLGGNPADFSTLYKGVALNSRQNVTYTSDGKNMTAHMTSSTLSLTWKGASNNTWSGANWDGSTDNMFIDGDSVTFDDSGLNRNIVVGAGGVLVTDMLVNNSVGKEYSFSGGGITGASITKKGGGALSLSNDSSAFAGTFSQEEGTVNLSNKLGGTYRQNGGILNTSGSAELGSANFQGTLNPTGTLNLRGEVAFEGATVNLGKLSAANKIVAAGSIFFAGAASTIAIEADGATAGDYTLISSSGGSLSGGSLAKVTPELSGTQRGGTFTAGNALMYRLLTGNTALTWAGTPANNVWNTNNTGSNWTDGTIFTSFLNGDTVSFGDSASGRSIVVGDGGVRVNGMTVNNSSGNNFNFSGGSIGGASLIKSGGGALDLNNESTFTTVTVNGGSLTAGSLEARSLNVASGASLLLNTMRLSNGRTLAINNQGTLSFNGLEVEGTGNSISGSAPSAAGKRLHFILPESITAGSTMLRVPSGAITTAVAVLAAQASGMNISGATLTLGATGYLSKLNPGDTITLIDHTSGSVTNPKATYTANYGASSYLFTLTGKTDSLGLIFQEQQNNLARSAKPYLEAGISGLAMVSEGGRSVAVSGVQNMMAATQKGPGMSIIAGMSGSSYRYDTGSHVDVDGMSVISGPVWRFDNRAGVTRLGLFVEAGWGNYDTYNTFAKGDGDLEHYGGGIMLRHDWTNGLYAETSFRGGMISTEFSSGDMGDGASFDEDTSYLGGHAGLGWIWSFTDKDSLDLYGKFFWTRQNGYTAHTDADERVRLNDADSLSTRLGGRYNHKFNDCVSAYIGAAWDREFDGKQSGKIDGASIDSPTLEGDSAFGELGLGIAPGNSPWSADLKFYGSAGRREGVGGNLSFSYEF